LVDISKELCRPPILSYASYCLNNWSRIDPNLPIELGNIKLIRKFVECYDEDWFVLVHVEIEHKGAKLVDNVLGLKRLIRKENPPISSVTTLLAYVEDSLVGINKTMNRMPEKCSTDVYFNKVRPYIFGFQDVVYEGCFENKPQSYRGETGAQSSLVPFIQLSLGITHIESKLTKHLDDMRNYMPLDHRDLLETVEDHIPPYTDGSQAEAQDIRAFVLKSNDRALDFVYNNCVDQLYKFRKKHFDYAMEYIHKKVTNPTGTGGTPYIEWLGNSLKETEGFLIKR